MKITPLILFFILLVVLVLSIIFSRYLPLKNTQEGLIGFNSGSGNEGNSVNIPQYNNTTDYKVTHLHDSLYFDKKNGNLIEVNGQIKQSPSDSGNTAINGIVGMTRNQKLFTYNDNSQKSITESSTSTVSSSFNYFIYTTPNDFVNDEKYKVVYISYGTDTILHILKIMSPSNIYKLIKTVFINSGTTDIKNWDTNWLLGSRFTATDKLIDLNTYKGDTSTENIIASITDNANTIYLYQLMRSAIYDQQTGSLYLLETIDNSTPTSDKKYYRNGNEIEANYKRPTTTTLLSDSTVNHPWATIDSDNNLIIFYPYTNKTIIVVLREIGSNGNLSFGPVVRFNGKQLDNGYTVDTPSPSPSPNSGSGSSGSSPPSSEKCADTDLACKIRQIMAGSDKDKTDLMYDMWLPYFNSLVSSGTSNDYMLKTQIVPPVCPQCPDCKCGDGVCNTCGGNGGSGTKVDDKTKGATGSTSSSTTDKILNDNKNNQDTRFNNSNVGGTISNVSDDVTGLVGSTVGTAGGIVGSTIGTAGGIVNNAINTTGSLLYSAGSGAVNLLKPGPGQSQTGPVGLNYQTQQPGVQQRDQYYSQGQGQGQINTPIDNYSQYGALPSRGGNYMPMTADFSRFGK